MLDESAALQCAAPSSFCISCVCCNAIGFRYEKASVEASLKLQRMIQQHPTVVGVTLRSFTFSHLSRLFSASLWKRDCPFFTTCLWLCQHFLILPLFHVRLGFTYSDRPQTHSGRVRALSSNTHEQHLSSPISSI